MFYVNKSNNEEVVELIYSEQGIVIVIDQEETLRSGEHFGKIVKEGKKQFKKSFRKATPKVIKMEPTPEEIKQTIIDEFLTNKIGVIKYTDEYVEHNKLLERREYFENISDDEYYENLEKYADPTVSKKPMNRKDLLKAKEALLNIEITT